MALSLRAGKMKEIQTLEWLPAREGTKDLSDCLRYGPANNLITFFNEVHW